MPTRDAYLRVSQPHSHGECSRAALGGKGPLQDTLSPPASGLRSVGHVLSEAVAAGLIGPPPRTACLCVKSAFKVQKVDPVGEALGSRAPDPCLLPPGVPAAWPAESPWPYLNLLLHQPLQRAISHGGSLCPGQGRVALGNPSRERPDSQWFRLCGVHK